MIFNTLALVLAALFSTLVTGRPFDSPTPRHVVRRDRSYSVVNVGGDPSTPVPATATSVIETTKTVEIVGPGETVTQEVTATIVKPQPAPAPTTSCSSSSASKSSSSSSSSTPTPFLSTPAPTLTTTSTSSLGASIATPTISSVSSSSISTPIETPKPIFVTVTVSKEEGPTEYYDDGMWHTYYRVKTFEAAAVVTAAP